MSNSFYGLLITLPIVLISISTSKVKNCVTSPVCGSNGHLYEIACDFERARVLNQNLAVNRLDKCTPNSRRAIVAPAMYITAALLDGVIRPGMSESSHIHTHTHDHNHNHTHTHTHVHMNVLPKKYKKKDKKNKKSKKKYDDDYEKENLRRHYKTKML